jgi:transcription antitermination factor NusG
VIPSIGSALALVQTGTPRWYAAQVAGGKELAVARRFPDSYVPTWTSTVDGRPTKRPLITGYTFFRCLPEQIFAVGHLPGVIGWITEIGSTTRPAVIPDAEIEALKYAVSREARPLEEKLFDIDQRVRITNGPLTGQDGTVVRRGRGYVTVGYTLFNRALTTRFDPLEVVPL